MQIARRLSVFYLGYFSLLGVMLPYLSLYFLDLGLTPYQIGITAAIPPLVKVVAPGFWGWLADRTGRRRMLVRIACVGALCCFSLMLAVTRFGWIVVVLSLYAIFTSSLLPLVEATAMEAVDRIKMNYGKVRLWGSVGFIVGSLGMGPVLDVSPAVTVLWIIVVLLIFNTWSAWSLPEAAPTPAHAARMDWGLLLTPQVMLFYGICMLMQASHGTYYGFFSIYLDELGYSRGTIGLMWAVGVAAEVVALARSQKILARWGARRLITLALMLTALRWVLVAAMDHPIALVGTQLLHAASFGLFHVAAVTHTHRLMPEGARAMGQSLYSSLSFGLGLTVSMYLNGMYYETVGPALLFAVSACVAGLAAVLSLWLQPITIASTTPDLTPQEEPHP